MSVFISLAYIWLHAPHTQVKPAIISSYRIRRIRVQNLSVCLSLESSQLVSGAGLLRQPFSPNMHVWSWFLLWLCMT